MTSIVDTFNRADSATTLGTTSDGSTTWTALQGTWGISSNRAYVATVNFSGTQEQVAVVDAGTADIDSQVTFAAIDASQGMGLAFRVIDISNFLCLDAAGRVFYYSAGTFTSLGTFVSGGFAAGDVAKVSLTGTTINVYKNGALQATVTSSICQTATKFGLRTGPVVSGTKFDDFSTGTPPAPPAWHHPNIVIRSRTVARASVI